MREEARRTPPTTTSLRTHTRGEYTLGQDSSKPKLFLSFFGGPPVSLKLGGPRMDGHIQVGFALAVQNIGGEAYDGKRVFKTTHKERLSIQGLFTGNFEWTQAKRLARTDPDGVVEEERVGTIIHNYMSENSWVGSARNLESAVKTAVTFARSKGGTIAEIAFVDHGEPGYQTFGEDLLLSQAIRDGGHQAQVLSELRPFVDGETILTLAGCGVWGKC